MAHASQIPASSRIPYFAIVLVLGVAGAILGAWYLIGDEGSSSRASSAAVAPEVPAVRSAPVASSVVPPVAAEEVVVVASNAEHARELRQQIAQDEYLAASFGGPRAYIAVVTADQWISDLQLSELNAIRASFGEPPLTVVYVD